jgi:hypothetical protein
MKFNVGEGGGGRGELKPLHFQNLSLLSFVTPINGILGYCRHCLSDQNTPMKILPNKKNSLTLIFACVAFKVCVREMG